MNENMIKEKFENILKTSIEIFKEHYINILVYLVPVLVFVYLQLRIDWFLVSLVIPIFTYFTKRTDISRVLIVSYLAAYFSYWLFGYQMTAAFQSGQSGSLVFDLVLVFIYASVLELFNAYIDSKSRIKNS
jgi:uncharacterized membrane protein AbrB (regulator of aidB expression)